MGAAVSFYAAGIRGYSGGKDIKSSWVKYSLWMLIAATIILIIPLGSEHFDKYSNRREAVKKDYYEMLDTHLKKNDARLIGVRKMDKGNYTLVEVDIAASKVPEKKLADELLEISEINFREPVRIQINTLLQVSSGVGDEEKDSAASSKKQD